MDLRVAVRGWSAWAAGLGDDASWRAWARAPWLPAGAGEVPALPSVPALARRRLSGLGRAVFHVTERAGAGRQGLPLVFASRYGDVDRALTAIESLAAGEGLSPTAFAASVHNGIGAMFSIIGGHTGNMVCVAAGAHSAAAGVVEAATLLADGADEVLLACYDEPLPLPYGVFADEPAASYAWAWRLGPASPGEPGLRLRREAAGATEAPQDLPAGLAPLRWWLADDTAPLRQADAAACWHWSRDA